MIIAIIFTIEKKKNHGFNGIQTYMDVGKEIKPELINKLINEEIILII